MPSTMAKSRPEAGASASERRRLRARRELAVSAVALFEQKGFKATTVEEIAAGANYSKSTFFRHFLRKEDVLFYVIPDMVATLRRCLEAAPSQDAWTTVRDAFLAFAVEWESADPEFTHARARLWLEVPELQARYSEFCSEAEDIVAQIFAAERGADPEKDFFSTVVAGAILGADTAALRAQARSGGRLVDHVAASFDLLETGFRSGSKRRRSKFSTTDAQKALL